MCLVPDGDLFTAIRKQRASVVTDEIDTFTEKGVRLKSGAELEADLIVTATGLNLEVLSGIALTVDGQSIEPPKIYNYKGLMFSGVPNLAASFGYTNASWTLKCDLSCEYVCRLLNHMAKHGYRKCVPTTQGPLVERPWVDFSSGYIQRSLHLFPKQGARTPWRLRQNYALDILMLRYSRIDDGVLRFSAPS
jgi:monooxygenase